MDYDRARVLQSLGYWVKIWGLPVGLQDLDAQPYIARNIENDVGLKDLIKVSLFAHLSTIIVFSYNIFTELHVFCFVAAQRS